jgi:hypothetical protein
VVAGEEGWHVSSYLAPQAATTANPIAVCHSRIRGKPWEERNMDKIVIIIDGGLPQAVIATRPTQALFIDFDTEGAEDDELMPTGKNMAPAVARIVEVTNDAKLVQDYFDNFDRCFPEATNAV